MIEGGAGGYCGEGDRDVARHGIGGLKQKYSLLPPAKRNEAH